ncbi:amidohydrolase family protein [Streptomyces sp. NPDC020681]|uniref:amidohydrolase family protein n=1 Tax=Streptomyces sp. NPDC020681 TaxID=3365083 RepID=UPI003799D700
MSELGVSVIDAHVHHFDLQKFRYPWLEDPEFSRLRYDYGPGEYVADTTGVLVDSWVHIQAEVDHSTDPVAETAWIDALAAGGPHRGPVACVGHADLAAPDIAHVLERHCAYTRFRGIRQEAWFDPASTRADIPQRNLLDNEAWREGFRSLAHFGLSFDLLVLPTQLRDAARLVSSAPEVPVRPVWFYSLTDRSWAVVMFRDQEQNATVHQAGPRSLWNEVEPAWHWWDSHGRPGFERFGLTVTAEAQTAWLDTPDRPAPDGDTGRDSEDGHRGPHEAGDHRVRMGRADGPSAQLSATPVGGAGEAGGAAAIADSAPATAPPGHGHLRPATPKPGYRP